MCSLSIAVSQISLLHRLQLMHEQHVLSRTSLLWPSLALKILTVRSYPPATNSRPAKAASGTQHGSSPPRLMQSVDVLSACPVDVLSALSVCWSLLVYLRVCVLSLWIFNDSLLSIILVCASSSLSFCVGCPHYLSVCVVVCV